MASALEGLTRVNAIHEQANEEWKKAIMCHMA